jgi:hypothetical protein
VIATQNDDALVVGAVAPRRACKYVTMFCNGTELAAHASDASYVAARTGHVVKSVL